MTDYSKQFNDMKANIIDRMAQRGNAGANKPVQAQNPSDPVVQALKNFGAKRKGLGLGNLPGRRL